MHHTEVNASWLQSQCCRAASISLGTTHMRFAIPNAASDNARASVLLACVCWLLGTFRTEGLLKSWCTCARCAPAQACCEHRALLDHDCLYRCQYAHATLCQHQTLPASCVSCKVQTATHSSGAAPHTACVDIMRCSGEHTIMRHQHRTMKDRL